MKLLTATHEGQGDRAGDLCFAAEGELVMLGEMCATDRNDPLGGCGCSRAFAGLASRRATTTALVRDLDLTRYDIELAVTAQFAADGLRAETLGDKEYAELFTATVDEMVRFGAVWPAGTVVRAGPRQRHHSVAVRRPAAPCAPSGPRSSSGPA